MAWLEPYPDAALEAVSDPAPGPDARYEMHESVQLEFVAAIQHLPPRQRAVLLLRDVLGWSAAETASQLDASVASVNSALQRARATLGRLFPSGRPDAAAPIPDDRQRDLIQRYVRAWEDADLHRFVALLSEDAVLSMRRSGSGTRDATRSRPSFAGPPPRSGTARGPSGWFPPPRTASRPSPSTSAVPMDASTSTGSRC